MALNLKLKFVTTAEKKSFNIDKTVPRLQTSKKNDAGDFTIILNPLTSSGITQLKKKQPGFILQKETTDGRKIIQDKNDHPLPWKITKMAQMEQMR